MADFKLPVAPIFDGESFELDGDIIKGKGGGGGAEPDDATIELNADGKLQIKDGGVALEKFESPGVVHAGEAYIVGDDGNPTLGNVGAAVDDVTIELNTDSELQVKNRSITLDKMASQGVVNANRPYIVGNDGNPTLGYSEIEWLSWSTRPIRESGVYRIPEMEELDLETIAQVFEDGRIPALKYYKDYGKPDEPTYVIFDSFTINDDDRIEVYSTLDGETVTWYYPDEEGMVGIRDGRNPIIELDYRIEIGSDNIERAVKLARGVYYINIYVEAWEGVFEMQATTLCRDFSINGEQVIDTEALSCVCIQDGKYTMTQMQAYINDRMEIRIQPFGGDIYAGDKIHVSGIVYTRETGWPY